jgi:hypothetical protein
MVQGQPVPLKTDSSAASQRSPCLIEPECSSTCAQQLMFRPRSEPVSPVHTNQLLKNCFDDPSLRLSLHLLSGSQLKVP